MKRDIVSNRGSVNAATSPSKRNPSHAAKLSRVSSFPSPFVGSSLGGGGGGWREETEERKEREEREWRRRGRSEGVYGVYGMYECMSVCVYGVYRVDGGT